MIVGRVLVGNVWWVCMRRQRGDGRQVCGCIGRGVSEGNGGALEADCFEEELGGAYLGWGVWVIGCV